MTTHYYNASVATEKDVPLEILGEAIHRAVRQLTGGHHDEVAVRAEKLPKAGEGGGLKVDGSVDRILGPLKGSLPKVPEPDRRVYADDLSDPLRKVFEWANAQMEAEARKKPESRPFASGSATGTATTAWNDGAAKSPPTFPLKRDAAKRYYIEIPDEMAKRLGFRSINSLSITDSKGETLTMADTHFQEPVTQPGKRPHPFDGEERFDDKSVSESTPRLQELINSRRPVREVPEGEGDWQLDGDDHVGEDK